LKKLVSSSEAANILGLSLQGVHYRIKKGQLESQKKDGKIFVYVDDSNIPAPKNTRSTPSKTNVSAIDTTADIIKVKDQQIELLKKTIKYIKKQKDSEVQRLQSQQDKIIDVFQSEVDLLKSAFNEMRNIYQIENKKDTTISKPKIKHDEQKLSFMNIKDFFIFMRKQNKTDQQIKQMIIDRVKSGDKRFIYNKKNKNMIIFKSDFYDLI